MQSLADAVSGLVCSVASFFVAPTVLLLMLKMFVPALGEPIWRAYWQLLVVLITAPFKLISYLIKEAGGRRRP